MTLDQQLSRLIHTINELKGEDIITLNVASQTQETEALVIATGRSTQHIRGLANQVRLEAKHQGMTILGSEGEDSDWMLIDLGEVVVHIMSEKSRGFYQLEKLWRQAPQ